MYSCRCDAILPAELWDNILEQVPRSAHQQTALSLYRALPHCGLSRATFFRHVRIASKEQLQAFFYRMSPRRYDDVAESKSSIKSFALVDWSVDPDVTCNLVATFRNLERLDLYIGPPWMPETLEALVAANHEHISTLTLRFNPYLDRRNYIQFLKGAYFDSTFERLARLPPRNNFVNFSFVQDIIPFSPLDESEGIAQPIILFRTFCLATFATSPLADSLVNLRLRIPFRSILTSLSASSTSTTVLPASHGLPKPFPNIQYLDISTSYVQLGNAFSAVIRRLSTLRHLVLDRTGVAGDLTTTEELGRLCASDGLGRKRDGERTWRMAKKAWDAEMRLQAQRERERENQTSSTSSQPTTTIAATASTTTSSSSSSSTTRRRPGRGSIASTFDRAAASLSRALPSTQTLAVPLYCPQHSNSLSPRTPPPDFYAEEQNHILPCTCNNHQTSWNTRANIDDHHNGRNRRILDDADELEEQQLWLWTRGKDPPEMFFLPSCPTLESVSAGVDLATNEERESWMKSFAKGWQEGIDKSVEAARETLEAYRAAKIRAEGKKDVVLLRFNTSRRRLDTNKNKSKQDASQGKSGGHEGMQQKQQQQRQQELKSNSAVMMVSSLPRLGVRRCTEDEAVELIEEIVDAECIFCTVADCAPRGEFAYKSEREVRNDEWCRPASEHVAGCGHLAGRKIWENEPWY